MTASAKRAVPPVARPSGVPIRSSSYKSRIDTQREPEILKPSCQCNFDGPGEAVPFPNPSSRVRKNNAATKDESIILGRG